MKSLNGVLSGPEVSQRISALKEQKSKVVTAMHDRAICAGQSFDRVIRDVQQACGHENGPEYRDSAFGKFFCCSDCGVLWSLVDK